jgi:cellulose biosynthesis protein BcsQ
MTSYAFWNNKGGVGKSYLSFIAASEYAHRHPDSDTYVIDLCPQGNVSEILIGSDGLSEKINSLIGSKPRKTIGGYIEARLSSPFVMIPDVDKYIVKPVDFNKNIPNNLYLIAGDYLLEVLAEAMRQSSQLSVPLDAWKQVMSWVRDLVSALRARSGNRDSIFIIDCNPSFAVYTQMAISASDNLVIPFTADDSSRRAIENVLALLYGIGDPTLAAYARISFARKARDEGISIPKLHTFVSNRVTMYEGRPSMAFRVASKRVKDTIDDIHRKHRNSFATPSVIPSKDFVEVPDYHSACIVSSLTGTPVHKLRAGPRELGHERIQINKAPLDKYRKALSEFVDRL